PQGTAILLTTKVRMRAPGVKDCGELVDELRKAETSGEPWHASVFGYATLSDEASDLVPRGHARRSGWRADADRHKEAARAVGPGGGRPHAARQRLWRPPQRCRVWNAEFRYPDRRHPWFPPELHHRDARDLRDPFAARPNRRTSPLPRHAVGEGAHLWI